MNLAIEFEDTRLAKLVYDHVWPVYILLKKLHVCKALVDTSDVTNISVMTSCSAFDVWRCLEPVRKYRTSSLSTGRFESGRSAVW